MASPLEEITVLEWLNYEATQAIAEVTPGLDLALRDDLVITSSELFPAPDTTHACLIRTTPENADDLIDEVIDYFQSKELPVTVFISPGCTPPGLSKRLKKRGFVKNKAEEAWLVIADLPNFKVPDITPGVVEIKRIAKDEALTFADTFAVSYEMPPELAEPMAQLVEPSVGLPGVYHYLGFLDEQPIATFSLICHKNLGILGSAGVVPSHRGTKVAANLLYNAEREAQQWGAEVLLLQTEAGTMLERLLRSFGRFNRVFKRSSFTLS